MRVARHVVALAAAGLLMVAVCSAEPEGHETRGNAPLAGGEAAKAVGGEVGNAGECWGKVVDQNGTAVEGARVRLFGPSLLPGFCVLGDVEIPLLGETRTDSEGSFSIMAVPDRRETWDDASVVAEKQGFALGWAEWEAEKETGVTIRLLPPSVLAGNVVDEEGQPIVGAEVRALLTTGSGDSHRRISGYRPFDSLMAKTDEEGRFAFHNIPPGAHADFLAGGPNRAFVRTDEKRSALDGSEPFAAGQEDIRIVLPRGARIEGLVYEEGGRTPLSGIALSIRKAGSRYAFDIVDIFTLYEDVRSDKDGRFTFRGLRAGRYVIELADPLSEKTAEWVAMPVSAYAAEGETANATVWLEKGGIVEVAVFSRDTGEPLKGVWVDIGSPGIGDGSHRGLTGEDGVARVRVLPGSHTTITVSDSLYDKPRCLPERFDGDVAVGKGSRRRLEFRLVRVPKLSITALDPDGKPVAGAQVLALPGTLHSAPSFEVALTDKEGRYQGTWESTAGNRDPRPKKHFALVRYPNRGLVALVKIGDGSEDVDAKVTLEKGTTFVGQVVDFEKKPITGAEVTPLIDVGLTINGRRWHQFLFPFSATTDEDGRYEIKALPSGHGYELLADPKGHVRLFERRISQKDSVKGRVEAPELVLLVANLSVSGVVVDGKGEPVQGAVVAVFSDFLVNRHGVTDDSGRFTVDGLCQGPVQVRVEVPGTGLSGYVEVEAGTEDVKVIIEPPYVAHVPVWDLEEALGPGPVHVEKGHVRPRDLALFQPPSLFPRTDEEKDSVRISPEEGEDRDLACGDVAWTPAQPRVGDEVFFAHWIANVGSTAVQDRSYVKEFYVGRERVSFDYAASGIERGSTIMYCNRTFGWKPTAPGKYRFKLIIKALAFKDKNPSNNVLEGTIEVLPSKLPDPAMTIEDNQATQEYVQPRQGAHAG